jgi:hypothetical protein
LANVALAGWIAFEIVHPNIQPPKVPWRVVQSIHREEPPPETNAPVTVVAPLPRAPFHWSQVESTNYVVYIENLRAIHCPERVIRSLITSELTDLYVQQRQQLLAPWQGLIWDEAARALRSPEKWEKQMGPTEKEMEQKDTQLKEEKNRLLKILLGDAPAVPEQSPPKETRVPDALAGYLTEEKQNQVGEIGKKYDKLMVELYEKNRGKPSTERRAQSEELDRQKRREIQSVLTPGEFDEYSLRTSSGASLRHQVYGFDTTPEELRELARKKMEFDEAHPAPQGNSAEAKAQREEWQKTKVQLDDQYKSVLGADRFAAFQRSQEGDYQDILRVVERCELPAENATRVFDMKRAFEESAQQLRQTTTLNEEERALALEVIRQETERTVRQTLGDRGFQTYLRYRGDWLGRSARP